jgi:hypothetical protein
MSDFQHLPPDYEQRCAAYRAVLERAYASGSMDADVRAWLEQERKRIRLQLVDAQQLEDDLLLQRLLNPDETGTKPHRAKRVPCNIHIVAEHQGQLQAYPIVRRGTPFPFPRPVVSSEVEGCPFFETTLTDQQKIFTRIVFGDRPDIASRDPQGAVVDVVGTIPPGPAGRLFEFRVTIDAQGTVTADIQGQGFQQTIWQGTWPSREE